MHCTRTSHRELNSCTVSRDGLMQGLTTSQGGRTCTDGARYYNMSFKHGDEVLTPL